MNSFVSSPSTGDAHASRIRDLIAQTLLDNSEEAFAVLDSEGRFVFASAYAERLLRRSREEILGRKAWEEFPATGENIQRAHQRAFEERTASRPRPIAVCRAQEAIRRSNQLERARATG